MNSSVNNFQLNALIIPCYKVSKHILNVLENIGPEINYIFVIDDYCPENTGDLVKKKCSDQRVKVIRNEKNLGVGGSSLIGFKEAFKNENIDICIKIDGDNQMDPNEIKKIIDPLINENYDYVKGNRFLNNIQIENYPLSRFYGNIFLSFMSKLSTGYWDLFDPINGFTGIKREVLERLNLVNIDDRYYFESDMLFNLYNNKAKVKDVPVTITYDKDQIQNLNVFKESFNFFFKNLVKIYKRIKFNYFNRNFGLGSFFITSFLFFFIFTICYGGYNYIYYLSLNSFAPTGKILISAISCLLMILSLMIFLIIDNLNNPNK